MDWLAEVKSAAEEVLKVLGAGYKEAPYEEALAHELRIRKIPYERQRNFEILYKGYRVGSGRADLIINPLWANRGGKELVLELKAVKSITESHKRQAQVYMVSLNIDAGAVLSFSDKILLETVERPKKSLAIEVVKPKKVREQELKKTLERCAQEVYDYFGKEFIYREGGEKPFPEAISVELRLNGIDFSRGNYDILYKGHKIVEYKFDFVFKNEAVANLVYYKKEENLAEMKEEFDFYRKLFGIKRGFLIAIPEEEKGKVLVEEV